MRVLGTTAIAVKTAELSPLKDDNELVLAMVADGTAGKEQLAFIG